MKEKEKEKWDPEWDEDRGRRKRLIIFGGLSKQQNKEDKNNKDGKYLGGKKKLELSLCFYFCTAGCSRLCL